MRVLMLTQFYPPTLGGEEQHVRALSAALAARGHDVSVATLRQPGTAEEELDGAVRVHRLRGVAQRISRLYQRTDRRHVPPMPDPGLAWQLRRVLARERPQIVHAHNWLVHSYLPLKAASRAKLILSLHDYSLLCVKKRWMYQGAPCAGPGIIKCLRCATDHYGAAKGVPIVLANWAMSPLERHAVDWYLPVSRAVAAGNAISPTQSDIVPNFVPDDVADLRGEPPPELSQLPDGDFLMFAGDLTRDKGVAVLLAAYAGLRDAPPLVLIGRPCADTPTSLPTGVRMLHSWPHAAVMWAWRRCLLALVPSVWPEPGGIVALEAMASGRPVIASKIGGLPELIADGETGILVRPGDPGALRAAIVRLLNDRDLREQMGRAAVAHVTQFHVSRVAPLVERAYTRVLRGTSAASSGFELGATLSPPEEPAAIARAAAQGATP